MNSIYFNKILIIICIILLNNNINNNNNTTCHCSVHYINNTYFKSVPTIIKTFENDSVLLPCNTLNSESLRSVQWSHDDKLIVNSSQSNIIPPSNIKLYQNGSLLVSTLKRNDTGEYVCQLITINGLLNQEHAIEVQYPPIVKANPKGIYNASINTIFDILCDADGIPYPVMTWTINGEPILNNTKRLYIEVDDINMSGPIECMGTNGVGEPATDGVILKVMFPPFVTPVNRFVHTSLKSIARLECYVESYPKSDVMWKLNGFILSRSKHFKQSEQEQNEGQMKKAKYDYYSIISHVLTIEGVKDSDLGWYECLATNKLGFKSEKIELSGRPMPVVFKKSQKPFSSTAHHLIWETESLSPILEYKLRFQQIPSGNITPNNKRRKKVEQWHEFIIPSQPFDGAGSIHSMGYEIKGLLPKSVYQAEVIARNRYGWSDKKNTIRFATTEEQPELTVNYTTEIIINVSEDDVNTFTYSPEEFINDLSMNSMGTTATTTFLDSTSTQIFCLHFFIIKVLINILL